jgi:hypothetical protein
MGGRWVSVFRQYYEWLGTEQANGNPTHSFAAEKALMQFLAHQKLVNWCHSGDVRGQTPPWDAPDTSPPPETHTHRRSSSRKRRRSCESAAPRQLNPHDIPPIRRLGIISLLEHTQPGWSERGTLGARTWVQPVTYAARAMRVWGAEAVDAAMGPRTALARMHHGETSGQARQVTAAALA